MKPNAFLRRFLVTVGSAALTATYTHAATLYWDGSATQTADANGGTGTWINGTTTNWDTLPFGGADSVWTNGANTAHFGATAGTVTIGTGGVTVGGLTFNTTTTTAYTLNAGTNGLNFSSGTNYIDFAVNNGNAAATITGQVLGTGANVVLNSQNLTRTATLTLDGAGTGGWSGSTTISANTILALGSITGTNSANTSLASTSAININGGGLTLNFGTGASMNRVTDSALVTFNGGGTVAINTALSALTETLGNGVTIASGQANFVYNNAPSSGGFITLPTLTRSVNTASVTFSGNFASGANFVVTGAPQTAAGEIIGAWATTGGQSGAAAQTDYAVYNASSQIRSAGIAASAETTWTTAHASTSNFTMSAIDSGTISGGSGRNVNSLRALNDVVTVTAANPNITLTGHTLAVGDLITFSAATIPTGLTAGTPYYVVSTATNTIQVSATSGGTAITPSTTGTTVRATGGILLSSGNNLGTFGILNGSATTLNILATGTGAITLPTTSAGNLFVTTGAGAITIAAPIQNNTGALTLVKNGTGGTLTLSGTNTYTGGTVLNAGTLSIGNVNNIGGASANLTINGTATLTPTAALNFSSGTLTVNQGALATIAAGGNVTFATTTGAGTLGYSGQSTLNLGNASGLTGTLAALQTSSTQIVQFSSLNGNTAGTLLAFGGNANDSNQRTNFLFSGSAPLTFTATGRQVALTPSTNTNGGAKINVLQNNSASGAPTPNTWVIDSDLIYTGNRGNIMLVLDGSNTDNNAFNGAMGNSTMNGGPLWVGKTGAGKWILDGANTFTGRLVISQGTLSVDTLNNSNVAGALGMGAVQLGGTESAIGGAGLYLGNNTGTLEYTGGLTSTSRQFLIGDATAANTGGGNIVNNGSGTITFSAANFNTAIASITATRTVTFGGSYTGGINEVQGIIQDNVSSTGRIAVSVNGSGSWTLSGNNTYDGVTTVGGGSGITPTLTLSGDNSGMAGGVTVSTSVPGSGGSGGPRLNINSATALGTGTLSFGGGAATDTVRLDNTSAGLVTVTTANVFTLNRNFTFIGTQSLDLGTAMTTTIGGLNLNASRIINVTANTLTFGSAVAVTANGTNGLTKGGGGKLAFNGNAAFNGTILISGGILELGGTAGRLATATAITNNANLTINRSNAFTQASDLGAGVAITGSGSFTQAGAGTTTLTNAANSYTGATTISNGVLSVASMNDGGSNSGIGASSAAATSLVFDGGTLQYTGANQLTNRAFTINTGKIATIETANDLSFVGATGAATNGALTKTGNGKLTITGVNTYTGATTVSDGTLAVNGSLDSTAVTVANGATLQGSGSIAGSVTVDGTLAAGNSIESLSTGALTLNGTSTFAYEIQTNLYAGTPGVSADLTDSSGTLDIVSGAILTITDLDTTTALAPNSKLTLISYMGGWTGGELFTYLGNTLADNSIFTLGANQWFFDYNDTSGGLNYSGEQLTNTSFVTMTVIPETSTALLSGLGALALLRRRRK